MNVRAYRPLRVWLLWACCLSGCANEPADEPVVDAQRLSGEVTLLVVDDPGLADAAAALRAEWQARTGGALSVTQTALDALLALADPPAVDAIVYPAAQLGALAERGWIVPLPGNLVAEHELAWRDTFELLQIAETQWSQAAYAVPFGSPVLGLYYRADLVERLHKRPPQTWSEYLELAETLSRRENLGDAAPPPAAPWYGAVEPLAESWAALAFLARAAAYARHRDQYSALFHIETMQPLIDGPPFVRALEELVACAKLGPPNQLELDPAGVRELFLAGRAALAIAWPAHAALAPAAAEAPPATGFAELPGAVDVYNAGLKSWERRKAGGDWRVPLLGAAGRLGSISAATAQPEAAFQLLGWLSGREWGTRVSSASSATTLYRDSQLKQPQPWVDPRTDALAAQQYAQTVHDALAHQDHLYAVRLPGRAQYMAALDAAVRAAVRGEDSAANVLAGAAAEWQRVTESLGLDAQRQAYRHSLGLAP